jgi:hypothetical protein
MRVHQLKKAFDFIKTFFIQAVANGGSFNVSFDEAGVFEFFQVLRNGGLCQRQFVDNVPTNATFYF